MKNSKYEQIMLMHDPTATQLRNTMKTLTKLVNAFLITLIIIGFIAGIAISASNNKGIDDANAFGLVFDLDDDFLGSPFMVLLYVMSVFDFIAISFSLLFSSISLIFEAHCKSLDNTFRTAMLTQEIAKSLSPNNDSPDNITEEKASIPPTNNDTTNKIDVDYKIPVEVTANEYGKIFCPICGTEQNGDRYCCFHCKVTFINGQPNIPHWCAKCGLPGPYTDVCPKCGSTEKIQNKTNI